MRYWSFDASGRATLMDIVEEQTVADAILDRLVHKSVRVELMGESLRKIKTETNI